MVSCIIRDIVNSFNPTYCNDLKGLILELTRQALVGGGEVIKVFFAYVLQPPNADRVTTRW